MTFSIARAVISRFACWAMLQARIAAAPNSTFIVTPGGESNLSFTEFGLLLDTRCVAHKQCYGSAELHLKTNPFEYNYL